MFLKLPRLSLWKRATLLVSLLLAAGLSVAGGSSLWMMYNRITSEHQRSAESLARGLAQAVELAVAVEDQIELERLVRSFSRDRHVLFVGIYNQSNKLLAHQAQSLSDWQSFEQQGSTDSEQYTLGAATVEVQPAHGSLEPSAVEAPPHAARRVLVGRVVVALSKAPVHEAMDLHILRVVAVLGVLLLVGGLTAFFAVRSWTRRLDRLVAASARISKGDYTHALSDAQRDEIGQLVEALDCLRLATQARDADLRALNATLQQRVAERTRQLEQQARELIVARDRALELSRLKSEFLANVSHEIRTPMNAVIGMSELLLEARLGSEEREYAQTVHSSAHVLLALINDILDYSKIEAGKLSIEKLDFVLEEVARSAVAILAPRAAEKKLRIDLELAPEMPTRLHGDPGRLRQVLLNLLGNAIKFTAQGGVTVRIFPQVFTDAYTQVRFELADTGIGISDEVQSRLFQAFEQADGSTTRKYGGTGLGLAISRQLVTLMGGEIGVRSATGKGSIFWFFLPFERAVPLTDSAASARTPALGSTFTPALAAGSGLSKPMVLLVEDNPVNQRLAILQLQRLGYEPDAVANGAEALQAVGAKTYDLVLMDCQMPILDGYETTLEIRRREGSARHTVIVAMTANAMQGDHEKCLAVGMNAYLSKPFEQNDLAEILNRWIKNPPPKPGTRYSTRLPKFVEEAEPTVSRVRLDDLRAGLGSDPQTEEVLRQLVERFILQATAWLEDMDRALQAARLKDVANRAHDLKGSSGILGAARLSKLSDYLYEACMNDSLASAQAYFAEIRAEFDKAKPLLVAETQPSSALKKAVPRKTP